MYCATCKIFKNSTLVKQQTVLDLGGITASLKSKSKKFAKNEKCMQKYIYCHFESEGYKVFIEDVSVTLIDKTDGSDPMKRRNFRMHTLKSLAP